MATQTDFTLPRSGYATFDAITLKQQIRDRLNAGGVFTDQNYEGSNLNAIIDIVALSYHYLLFYLNQTSAETAFNQTTIYENMNRLVKLIDYKPTGYKTSLLSFQANGNSSLPAGLYTIPRYSYFNVNGTVYSFLKDTTFVKSTNDEEYLDSLSDQVVLYQGPVIEYPPVAATGAPFETVTLLVTDNINNVPINIDQESIGVYVRDVNTGVFTEYALTNSLFLENSNAKKYELRYNENGYYEIKFGNNVFGKALNPGDIVYLYYIQSDGENGVISANQLNGATLFFYTPPQFQTISQQIFSSTLSYLTISQASNITFSNNTGSSTPSLPESVDSIRNNSPKAFYGQNRLITADDFTTHIAKYFNNIVTDSVAVGNKEYVENFIKYFYDLGLTKPNDDPRVLFNQVAFSHSGQDNNVYLFLVPRVKAVDNNKQFFLQNSQKNTIISSMVKQKALSMELLPQDPVYTAFAFGLLADGETPTPAIHDTTELVIVKAPNIRVDNDAIVDSVNSVFKDYFTTENCKLGQLISVNDIVSKLTTIPGVASFYMRRVLDSGAVLTSNTLSLMNFNPNYSDVDITVSTSDVQLPFFKFPFLWGGTVENNIVVQ